MRSTAEDVRSSPPPARRAATSASVSEAPRRRPVREAAAVEPVVDQREAGPRRVRPERDAVDRKRADRRLERLGLEPLLGELARRHRQAAHHAEHVLAAEPAQSQQQRGERQAFAHELAAQQAGHGRAVGRIEEPGRAVHERDELRPARGIPRGEPADRLEGRGVPGIGRQPQRTAVRQQRNIRAAARRSRAQAVPLEVEVAHDVWPQVAGSVQHRRLDVRPQAPGGELASGHLGALEHQHLASGLGEIRGRDEPVVPGADDDHVVFRGAHRQSFRISCAASLPAAPITPPPGCAPEAPK